MVPLCSHRKSCFGSKFNDIGKHLWPSIKWKRLLTKQSVQYESNYVKIMYISIENLKSYIPKRKHWWNTQGCECAGAICAKGHPLERTAVVDILAQSCAYWEGPSFFFLCFYLFLRQTETEHEQGRGRERGRHRIRSGLQAPSCQHRARRGARTHELWDRDPSRSRTPNRLSHPGAPVRLFLIMPGTR